MAHTMNDTGRGILFLSIKLHRQTIQLLTERVLKTPPSESGRLRWDVRQVHVSTPGNGPLEQNSQSKQNKIENHSMEPAQGYGTAVAGTVESFCHIKAQGLAWHSLARCPGIYRVSPHGTPGGYVAQIFGCGSQLDS